MSFLKPEQSMLKKPGKTINHQEKLSRTESGDKSCLNQLRLERALNRTCSSDSVSPEKTLKKISEIESQLKEINSKTESPTTESISTLVQQANSLLKTIQEDKASTANRVVFKRHCFKRKTDSVLDRVKSSDSLQLLGLIQSFKGNK